MDLKKEVLFLGLCSTASFIFGIISLFKFLGISPDSMIYVEIVDNLINGNGFVVNQANLSSNSLIVPLADFMPLFPAVSAVVSMLFGIEPELSLRIISVLFLGLLPVPVYYLAKTIYDNRVAIYSALYITFMWAMIYNGSWAWTETMFTFFVIVSILYMAKTMVDKNSNHMLLAGVSSGLAYLTKSNGLFLILVAVLFILLVNKKLKDSILFILGFISISGIWMVRNIVIFGNPLHYGQTGQFIGFSLNSLFEILIRYTVETGLLFFVAIISLYYFMRKERNKTILLFSYPIIAILFFSGWSDNSSRLLSPAYPFVVIFGIKVLMDFSEKIELSIRKNKSYMVMFFILLLLPQIVFDIGYFIRGSPNPFRVIDKQPIEKAGELEAMNWISKNTVPEDVIYTNMPESVHYYADRLVVDTGKVWLNSTNVQKLNINYIVLFKDDAVVKGLNEYDKMAVSNEKIEINNVEIKKVYNEQDALIVKIV